MSPNPSGEEPAALLVERWHAGEDGEQVFRALFERFYGPLYRFFTRRGFLPEEAQDLIQETFLRVYKGIGSFRAEAKWENWLFQIASNTASKAWRHRSAKKRSGREVSIDIQVDGEPTPELDAELSASSSSSPALRQVLVREGAELLREAIEDLPPQMRRCVRLRVFQELEHVEIGELMQIAPATVKVQLFKARKRLQEVLGGHFHDFEF